MTLNPTHRPEYKVYTLTLVAMTNRTQLHATRLDNPVPGDDNPPQYRPFDQIISSSDLDDVLHLVRDALSALMDPLATPVH